MQCEQVANILLVDDSPANLLVLEFILNKLEINLVKANSGEEALNYLSEQDFAVILLDIQMPNMDGFETAKIIREREKNAANSQSAIRQTPIIFITAINTNEPYIFKGYSLGAVDYLLKPIQPEVLRAKVAVFVELFRNSQQVKCQAQQLEIANKKLEQDIIKRQLVEAALRESEERFRSAFDYAAIGMGLVAEDGSWLKVNRFLCEIVGYSSQELLTTTCHAIAHPEDVDKNISYLRQLLDGEIRSYEIEQRYFHKQGHLVWILLSMSLVRDAQENPLYFIAQIQDISERRRAEEALQQLASIVESSHDAISSETLDGIILSWNLGAERMYGYSAQEVKGKSVSMLLTSKDADDLPLILETIKEGGLLDNYETIRVRKNGEEFDVSLTISPIKDTTGKIVGAATIARDISDRKRNEETINRLWHQNELILNSAGEGICGLDLQGKIRFVNPAAARMLGYEVIELLYQPIHPILSQSKIETNFLPTTESLIYTPLAEGQTHHLNNQLFWRKNGSSFPVEYISTPIREEGEIVGVVLTFQDISDRLIVEQMKQEFVSVVSHELRTPLTSIRGALGLLAAGILNAQPEKAKRMLEIAVANTDRLIRLINDILDIERIESGKVCMEKETCDAANLIAQAVDAIQTMAENAKVTLSVTPISAPLWADSDRIIQTLTNLLSNAIKFSPENTTIYLTAELQPNQILFQVKDRGRGIPANKLESIFGRFQQVDASDSRQKGGTGLGLAICRSIVQQHGGQIWAESSFGEGSTFYFTLPLLKNKPDVATLPLPPQNLPVVLVCDDEPGVCDMVEMLIKKRGYEVLKTTSGEEVIKLAIQSRPDVILLNLIMPGMNGWETMAMLKTQPETKDIPIIIFSALSIEEKNAAYLDLLGWVRKPVDQASLLQTLEQCLQHQPETAKVLLVEDDRDLAAVLKTIFERHRIQTFHAENGRDAMTLIGQITPDLLVLDLGLPEYDGFEIVEWLRQNNRLSQIPLVVYSAKELNNIERERLSLGQTEFLTKSKITPKEFEQRAIALLKHIIPNREADFHCDTQTSFSDR